jgi:serine/threonine protein kinase
MTAHGHLGPGTILSGAYRVVRPLSEGGMGAVFVAEHVTTKKPRAIKIMHGELLNDPSLRDRFVQEAQIGSRIDSEHVVEVVDAGFDERLRLPWIAMELLEGEPLLDRLERGPIPAHEVFEILQQLCHALAAAHAVGIVHRDLKPENIFIARSRRVGAAFNVKVLDFGIAKVVAEAKATRMATAAIGTPLWMAPEQTEQGNNIAPATDVWALGLITFRMLTGRYYWMEAYRNMNNVTAILTEMLVTQMVPASHRAHELQAGHFIPAGFDQWFARCVNRDPRGRYPDARQAFDAIAPILRPPQLQSGGYQAYGTQIYGQGTQLGGMSPVPPTAAPPLMSPAHGVMAPPLHTPVHQQSTPAGVHMTASPPVRAPKKSSTSAFLIGLGSVLVLGAIAVVVIKHMHDTPHEKASDKEKELASKPKFENKWVLVKGVKKNVFLGVEKDNESPLVRGFRPARKVAPPFADFEMQQHEVTWGELDPFLASEKGHKVTKPEKLDNDKKSNEIPASGVPWPTAVAYCKSIGANLPTEEQWELAARGKELRKFSWGDEDIDLHRTRVFGGKKATLMPVMTNDQDKTPGDEPIFDLMGNAQEWTADVYQDDFAEQDEGWTQSNGISFRGLRGLPLNDSAEPALMKTMSAAFREPACATGACVPPGKGSGSPVVLIRTAFSTAVPADGGPARPQLAKLLADLKSDLQACADKTDDERGYLLKVDYTLPLKKFPVCRASDGYDDPMECCTGKVCAHAPHKLLKYDPAKVVITNPSDAMVPDSTGPGGVCAKAAIEKKLVGFKWTEAADEWSATVWVHRVDPKPPKELPFIGFRCVRPVSKGS